MAIITRVAKVNLVARKSKTGWSSIASFMSTNPAPQTIATKTSDRTAQVVLVIIYKRIHALSPKLRPQPKPEGSQLFRDDSPSVYLSSFFYLGP
jgi:hypothetical protein